VTLAETKRASEAAESLNAIPVISASCFPEHDMVNQKARVVATMLVILRFMFVPMNRATVFSRAPK
jgi:hypothetical protein